MAETIPEGQLLTSPVQQRAEALGKVLAAHVASPVYHPSKHVNGRSLVDGVRCSCGWQTHDVDAGESLHRAHVAALLVAVPDQTVVSEGLLVSFPVGDEWPSPNACRRAADGLDAIGPARFGSILRAYADAEDQRLEALAQLRRAARP